MSNLVIPNVFVAGTDASAAEVNDNFAAVADIVNGNLDATNLASVFTALTLAGAGGCKFPGGLVVNWGTAANVPIDGSATVTNTYTYAFSAAPFVAFAAWGGGAPGPGRLAGVHLGISLTTSPLTAIVLGGTGGTGGPVGAMWLVVGM